MNKVIILTLLVLNALACNRQADQKPDPSTDSKQHDELSSNYTLFSENLEFYIEMAFEW